MEIDNIGKLINLDLSQIKLVSFDFFDTLAQRRVGEKDLIQRCFGAFFQQSEDLVDKDKFLAITEKTETEVCHETELRGFDKETTVLDIYTRVFETIGVEDWQEKAKAFCRCLIDFECKNLLLNEGVEGNLQKLKAQGKKVIVISDTFYSKEDFKLFIDYLNISSFIDDVYLSAESKLNKYTGNLFRHVSSVENTEFSDIIHIGNNKYSDVFSPRKLGINAILFNPSVVPTEQMRYDFLYNFGYDILGPVLFDFVVDLYSQVSEETTLVFLGRDGFTLKLICDTLVLGNIDSYYLYINEVLSNQMLYASLDQTVFSYLDSQHKSEGIWGLVSLFGLDGSEFSSQLNIFLQRNNLDPIQLLTKEISKKILSCADLNDTFKSCLWRRKDNFVRYLDTNLDYKAKASIALVDVGWKGKIFTKIDPIFQNITRIHLLCYSDFGDDRITGFISMDNRYQQYFESINKFRDFIEYCLSENKSSVIYIDDNIRPTYHYLNGNNSSKRRTIQMGILDFCRKSSEMDPRSEQDRISSLDKLVGFLSNTQTAFIDAIVDVVPELDIQRTSGTAVTDVFPTDDNAIPSRMNLKKLQTMLHCFLDMIKNLKNEERLVVYGSGSGADFIVPHLTANCKAIVDLNEKTHGQSLFGIPIRPVNTLRDYHGKVIVSVIGRKNQIHNTLKAFNVDILFLEDYL